MFETGTASDYADLLEKLHTFLTTNGSAFGLVAGAGNTGNGTLTGHKGGTASVAETFTITATSATNFTVVGSVSGSLAAATVGTPYTGTKVQFLLTAGGTAFVAGDVFTLTTAPKWGTQRRARGCTVTATAATSGQRACDNVVDGKTVLDGTRDWNPPVATQRIELTLLEAETIVEYAILADGTFGPKTWTFDHWNGSSWVTLDTQTNFASFGAGTTQAFPVASPVSATRYSLNITAWVSGGLANVSAVELRRSAAGFNAAFSQYIWKAPGNDGVSEINVGIHHFRRVDADYFDWEIAAFDGFNAASQFYTQPGIQANLYVTLHNTSIPYWFVCNGRSAKVVAKIGSQYETAFLGLLEPFFTPAQVPLPMALGGTLAIETKPTWESVSWRWSNSTNQHRAPSHSDPNVGSQGRAIAAYQMRARKPDGTWAGFNASWNDNFDVASTFTADHWIWPYAGNFSLLDLNLDGGYAIWPVMLMHTAPNTLGQLDGISALTGQGMTAESTVRIGQVDHLAVPNITRTDRNDWLAVRLD